MKESNIKQTIIKKKCIAIVTILIMLLELFSPYSILLTKVKAAVDPSTDQLIAIRASEVQTASGGNKIIKVTYAIVAENVASIDFSIGFDSTKIKPAKRSNGSAFTTSTIGTGTTSCAEFGTLATDYFDTDTKKYTASSNNIRIAMSEPNGGSINLADEGYSAADLGDEAYGYNYYMPIVTLYFYLVDESITELTTDMLYFSPVGSGMPTGFKYIYNNGGSNLTCIDTDTIAYEGFSQAAKSVSSIQITTMPSKTQYYVGETLDYTGGEIKVTYDDSSEETISILDAIANGTITASSTVATNSKKVTFTNNGKTADFEYYLLDSISVSSPLSNMNYEHGDSINFAGGELTATYVNNAGASKTATLNIANELAAGTLSVDKQVADVDNQTITYTYYDNKIASMTLTVTDPIASISITTQPTTLTYSDGDTINLAGGIITPITKSGKTGTTVATDAATVTASTTTASIAQATNKWTIAGGDGLEAGNQTITLTYEGKTADYTIVVNDTVASVSVTTQATAKNKLGTPSTALDFTGLVATIQTSGGSSFTVGPNSLTIDRSSYNANSLSTQSFPVKYGTVSSSNNAEITLSNYITGISVNFTNTEFDYGTPLSTVLASGTYKENYADGTSSSAKAISSSMVTGYNATPAAALFGADHTYGETLTITLSSSSNSFDQLPATATQAITIKDKITGIAINTIPSTSAFNYGDSFMCTNGKIKTIYASGVDGTIISMTDSSVSLTEEDGSTINMSPPASEFVNGVATKTIKVTYTNNGQTFNAQYYITIENSITGIVIDTQPKNEFVHGDTFTVGSGTLKINYSAGPAGSISMSDVDVIITETDGSAVNMSPAVSEYTNNSLTKTLKVTYEGKTTTYSITIKNTVDSITVTAPSTTNYNLNDSTSLAGGKVVVTRKAGNTENVDLTDSRVTVTGFDTSVAGTNKTANVKYTEDGKDYTGTFNYSVANPVTGVTITAPTKTTYNHGDALDLTGGTITITYADTTTATEPITSATITESDGSTLNMSPASYDSTNKVDKTLKITYTKDGKTGTVNYPITIVNDVKSITVHSTNHKVNYNVNDTLDVTNLEILVTRATGTPEVKSVTADMVTGFSSTSENTALPLTISYTENGITKTVDYNVSVTDTVTAISLNGTNPDKVKYGEELDLSGVTIEVTKGSGKTTENVLSSMISGFNKNTLGKQTVTVTYGGKTATFEVTVQDYVTKVEVNPDSVTGTYNDELADLISDNHIEYTVTYAKAGAQSPVALTESMVTGYNKTSTTAQSLTVTYTDNDINSYTKGTDFTDTLTVTLTNTVASITIDAPSKTTYNHGDALDLTGGVINLTYEDSTTGTLDISNATITESDGSSVNMSPASYDSTNKVDKTLKITYTKDGKTGTVNYPITIVNDVKSITVHSTNHKVNYNVNDTLDVTNLEILVTRATGTPEVKSVTADMVTGFSSTSENTALPLTISYTENGITKTVDYNVSVTDTVTAISLNGTNPDKVKYGEELDLSGVTIEVTKGSGKTTENVLSSMISGFNKNTLGKQTVTVTYGGKTATFEVTVQDYVTKVEVNPDSVTGTYNDELADLISDNHIEYTVTYAKAGAQSPVALTESMVTGYNKTSTTAQSLTVTYTDNDINSYTKGTDFTDTLTVTLTNTVASITIDAPSKTTYNHGDALDLTGGVINLTYEDSTTGTLDISNATITESDGSSVNMSPASYDSTNKVDKTLKITYTKDGKTGTVNYPITIVNDVKSITVHSTNHKVNYNVNDTLDVTNLEILVTRATGTPEVKSVTADMVTGFSSTSENTALPLTISYTENGITKTVDYNVSVTDTVTAISLNGTNPDKVKYGEELDLSGVTIEVTKGSGKTTENVLSSMISGFNKNTLGKQTVTVTYGGKTATFEVTVQDYVTKVEVNPDSVTGTYNDELADLISDNHIEYTVTYAKAGAQSPVALTESMVTGYNKTSTTAQSLTVTYTDNDINSYTKGTDFTDTLTVQLNNAISSIVIVPPTKTIYEHGDTLDLSGGKVTVTYSDGTSQDINLENNMITENGGAVNMSPAVSDYVNNEVTKNLTITYRTETKPYQITIKNPIDSIAIANSPKTSYNLNDSTTGVGGTLTVTRKAGNTETISIDDSMVTGLDTTVAGTGKTATVTYTVDGVTKTTTYTYDVIDNVTNIEITAPSKNTYNHGDSLELTGGTITVTYASGTTANVTMTENMIKDGSNSVNMSPSASEYTDNKLTKTLTITYTENGVTKSVNYPITIINDIKSIDIETSPKTDYKVNESLDVSTGTISVTRATGNAETIQMTNPNVVVTGFDSSAENTALELTVTYTENGISQSTTYEVSVVDTVISAVIDTTPKTSYKYGEPLDVSSGKIKVTKDSGEKIIDMKDSMVTELDGTPFDSTKLGTRDLNVTYGGINMTYEITVSDYITGITLQAPTKDTYEYGEPLDLTGGSVTKVMASGTATTPVALTDASVTVTGYNPNQEGVQTITVTYEGESLTFTVEVVDNIQTISLNGTPKSEYKYGEPIDVSGLSITATKSSGATENITVTNSMISGYNPNQLGPQTVTVTYNNVTTTFNVNVVDYVKDIEIVKPTKLIYAIGETIDLTGGQVIEVMASGTATTPIAMTQAMISGFDSSTEGAKTITVTYGGFTKTFGITVQDLASSMIIKTLPDKLDYLYGEPLDVSGGTIEVTKESGAIEIINITKAMVSGYNPNKLGTQILTVTYEGLTQEFSVTVKDYVVEKLKVTPPNKTSYEYGESLDLTGGKVFIMMASGAVSDSADLAGYMVSGYDATKTGSQTIRVEYNNLVGNFTVNVVDKVKGISMNTEPNKTNYKNGESLDVSGATIIVTKSSGKYVIPVTQSMISGYNSKNAGTQVITVTYEGFKTTFVVTVEKVVTTNKKPSGTTNRKPSSTNTTNVTNTPTVEENKPQDENQKPVQSNPDTKKPENNTNKSEDKPTETLGVKDDKKDDINIKKLIAIGIAGLALLLLLILLVFKRNVKVYVEEEGEFVLGGLDKVSKNNLKINIDKYLDEETYPNRAKIVLSDAISEKLDGKELEITHRGNTIKHKIVYNDKPYEINLEKSIQNVDTKENIEQK